MKAFLEHFQRFRRIYTIITAFILVLGFSMLMPFLIQIFNIPSKIVSVGGVIVLLWWKAHVTGLLKIKSPIFLKLFKEPKHRIVAYILVFSLIVLVLIEMNNDLHAMADSAMAMTMSYYLSQWIFSAFDKLNNKATEKLEYFTSKDFEKLKAYVEKYDYFVVGDKTIENFYSMKINFPKDNAEDVMEFFNFFLSQPKFAFLVATIFKDIKLDDNNNMYINNKLETNPSKIGLHIMNRLSDYLDAKIDISEIK